MPGGALHWQPCIIFGFEHRHDLSHLQEGALPWMRRYVKLIPKTMCYWMQLLFCTIYLEFKFWQSSPETSHCVLVYLIQRNSPSHLLTFVLVIPNWTMMYFDLCSRTRMLCALCQMDPSLQGGGWREYDVVFAHTTIVIPFESAVRLLCMTKL